MRQWAQYHRLGSHSQSDTFTNGQSQITEEQYKDEVRIWSIDQDFESIKDSCWSMWYPITPQGLSKIYACMWICLLSNKHISNIGTVTGEVTSVNNH